MNVGKLLVGMTVAATIAGGTVAVAANAADGKPADDYVGRDGIVDMNRLPAEMQVVGPDGELVLDSHGRPVTLDPRKVFGDESPVDRQPTFASTDSNSVEAPPASLTDIIEAYGN